MAPVKNAAGQWGYINKKCQVELDFQWNDASSFSEGLASVSNGEEWFYINRQGEVAIPYQWTLAHNFHEGLASVLEDSGWGYINREGEIAIPAKWTMASDFNNGRAFVGNLLSGESGYIDRLGNFLYIQTEGSDAYPFEEEDGF